MLQVMQICKKSTSSLFHIIRRCFVPDADKLIHYLPEILYDKEIASGVRELSLIRHAQSVLFGEDNTGFPPWFRREHAFSERYLYRMCNVELLLPFGGVRFCGKWVQESFGNYGDVLWLVARFRVERLLRLLWQRGHFAYSDGVYTSLKAVGYYHFLLCALPEFLHVLKRYPDVKVLLCQDELYPFVGAFLDLLGVRQRICLPPWSRVFVSDYAFSAVESHCGFVPPDDIRLLRDTFLPLAEEGKNCQRIFLSRKKSTRSFSNQAELEDLMGSFGFTVVCLEEMTVLQQISLFRSAEVVVANHGAGLSNLVWGNSDVKVLELFSPVFLNDCYFRLAKALGMAYQHVIADGTGWGTVDLSKVKEVLSAIDAVG